MVCAAGTDDSGKNKKRRRDEYVSASTQGAPLKKRRLENATVKKEFEDFMKNETDATCDMVKMLCESAASATRLRFQGYENQLAVEVSSNQSESSVAEVARLETCANIDSLKLIRDLIDETRRNRLEFYLKYVNGRITPTPPTPSEIEDE